jgi:two-component system, NarL family, invasion response regulator UvrY
MAAQGITVLTVDDQPVFLRAAQQLIAATVGFVEVGQAASGPAALALAAEVRPDLVLLDLRMPGMDGVETARRLLAADPDVVVVLISLGEGADVSSSAVSAGVAAHVRKQELSTRTLSEIWAAHGGRGGQ